MAGTKSITVTVHYPRAKTPFEEEIASGEEVGQLMVHVLASFGLSQGGPTIYTLYHGHHPLSDPSETIGHAAARKRSITLNLVKYYHG